MLEDAKMRHKSHSNDVEAVDRQLYRHRHCSKYAPTYKVGREIWRKLQQLHRHRLTHHYEPEESPVYSLPTEILSRCFSHLAIDPTSDDAIENSSRKPFHVVLSVCRRWHDIAIDLVPELWTTIVTREEPRRIQDSADRTGTFICLH